MKSCVSSPLDGGDSVTGNAFLGCGSAPGLDERSDVSSSFSHDHGPVTRQINHGRRLQAARAAFEAGERGGAALKAIIGRRIAETPGAAVEYVEIVDAESFEPAAVVRRPALAALAVRLGATRLIDNIELTPEPQAEGAPPPPEDRAGTL